MALGEIRLRDWLRVIRRELAAGVALGTILGIIGISRICLWHALRGTYGPHYAVVALTIGCSLVGVVMFGTTAGSMLPFLLRRCGLDPASASAPFVATLVDVTGLIIYFSVASVISASCCSRVCAKVRECLSSYSRSLLGPDSKPNDRPSIPSEDHERPAPSKSNELHVVVILPASSIPKVKIAIEIAADKTLSG